MNNWQFIIEGIDGTGKSTLAKNIIEYFKTRFNVDLDYVHFTNHDPKDYAFYSHTMRKQNIVYDRHFVGEKVWGPLFRSRSLLSDNDLCKLFVQAALQHTIIIFCDCDIETVFENIEKREHILYMPKKDRIVLFQAQQEYKKIFGSQNCVYHYNYMKDDYREMLETIIHDKERIF